MEKTTLTNLGGGMIQNLFERELEKVKDNIADSRTSAEAERSITLKIKIKPDATREELSIAMEASSTLAKAGGAKAVVYAALTDEGIEIFNQNPGQQKLLGEFVAAQKRREAAAGGTPAGERS
jgi:hypothetical protein